MVKNPNWQEADQLAIYSQNKNHQKPIYNSFQLKKYFQAHFVLKK